MMAGSNDGGDRQKPRKSTDLHELNEKLKAQGSSSLKKVMEEINRRQKPLLDMQARMNAIRMATGEDSTLSKVSQQIADQQRAIDAWRSGLPEGVLDQISATARGIPKPTDLPKLQHHRMDFPPNPIHETNERLERIEERFEQMQRVAVDAAQIANGLQASAAEFLQKFEKAAEDNNSATHRVIWIGVIALVIAMVVPIGQFLLAEYRHEPSNGLAIQAALESIQAELTITREAQVAASTQLEDAIASSNGQMAAVLRDINDLLSGHATSATPSREAQNPGL